MRFMAARDHAGAGLGAAADAGGSAGASDAGVARESADGDVKVVMFGAPFDSTASYRAGSRFGPARIREASYSLEEYYVRLDASLNDVPFADAGDLELPHGSAAAALDRITDVAERILENGQVPLMLGGEHLLSLGAIRAAAARHPDLGVVQFDAHADLRHEYLGETLSHATVMRRVAELIDPARIHPLGIRSGSAGEIAWGRAHTAWPQPGVGGWLGAPGSEPALVTAAAAAAVALQGRPVYVTIDIDVLDPSEAPGTGTPEPGGVRFGELVAALTALRGLNIVGIDLVEVAPQLDPSGRTEIVAAAVLRHLLIDWFGGTAVAG